MKRFYISRVGESTTNQGVVLNNAIGIIAKDMSGREYPLRLLAGYDPYLSILVVRNGLLGLYRLDRRLTIMSENSEINGIDHDAISAILLELCRNLLSEESGIIFLKVISDKLTFPIAVNSVGVSSVYAGSQLAFTLTRARRENGIDVGIGRMPAYELSLMKKTITGIDPVFAKLFSKQIRAHYGKNTAVSYSGCLTKS